MSISKDKERPTGNVPDKWELKRLPLTSKHSIRA